MIKVIDEKVEELVAGDLKLKEDETLAQAGIPKDDRLMMTADVTAG